MSWWNCSCWWTPAHRWAPPWWWGAGSRWSVWCTRSEVESLRWNSNTNYLIHHLVHIRIEARVIVDVRDIQGLPGLRYKPCYALPHRKPHTTLQTNSTHKIQPQVFLGYHLLVDVSVIFLWRDFKQSKNFLGHRIRALVNLYQDLLCIKLVSFCINQEERSPVSINHFLGLIETLDDQRVHTRHLGKNRPGNLI